MGPVTEFLARPWGSRVHLVEFHEVPACPVFLRESVQDYLAFAWKFEDGLICKKSFAKQAAPVFIDALKRAGTNEVLDVCSGGGGPFDTFAGIEELKGAVSKFTLTDLFPNVDAFKRIAARHPGRVEFSEKPVDATACDFGANTNKRYLRTMCASMHHMTEDLLVRILKDCVEKDDAFLALELTARSIINVTALPLGSAFLTAIAFFLTFRDMQSWKTVLLRFIFTFLIPIIPILFVTDGFVSCLRTYTKDEFLVLAHRADPEGKFDWSVRTQVMDGPLIPLTSYVGIPKKSRQ